MPLGPLMPTDPREPEGPWMCIKKYWEFDEGYDTRDSVCHTNLYYRRQVIYRYIRITAGAAAHHNHSSSATQFFNVASIFFLFFVILLMDNWHIQALMDLFFLESNLTSARVTISNYTISITDAGNGQKCTNLWLAMRSHQFSASNRQGPDMYNRPHNRSIWIL